jgi:xanthine dehydrogenase YagR molybdenum-binding subunit
MLPNALGKVVVTVGRRVKTRVEEEGKIEEIEVEVPHKGLPPWEEKNLVWVGKGVPRVDGLEKCTGKAKYTYDIHLPGMLYGKILRCTCPHARLITLNTGKAQRLSGVKAILTHENAPSIPWYEDSFLFDRTFRCVGEEVAAVAAVDEYVARDALDLIEVEYEPLPFVVDPEEALRPGSPPVRPGGNLLDGKPIIYSRGDIGKGFDEADLIIEDSFSTQVQAHTCMETHGSVASWEGDYLTVWDSTQGVSNVQEGIANALGIPMGKVRVIKDHMGGGFGSKTRAGKYTVIAALLAKMTGRPVKLMLDRKEEFYATGHRPSSSQHLRVGVKKDGSLTAIYLKNIGACGAYQSPFFPTKFSMIDALARPYRELYLCPNVKTEMYPVYNNIPVHTAQRAPGHVEGTFALEQVMDQIADQLGMDPVSLRMKNYTLKDQVSDFPYTRKALAQCYQKGAEKIDWEKRNKKPGDKKTLICQGIGMASQIWGGGGGPPAYAIIKINQDSTANLLTGSQDIGTGSKTVFVQIAAEELGISPKDITITLGDTETTPYAPRSSGSRTIPSVGPAVRSAAADAKRQLLDLAGSILDLKAEDLAIREGEIYLKKNPTQKVPLKEITRKMGNNMIIGMGSRGPNPPQASINVFGAQFAQVEVNTATGEIRVLKVVSVHDVGRVINPMTLNNQIEGGIIQGMGYGLMEEVIWDKGTGIMLTPNLHAYKLPTILDMPEIVPGAAEGSDPANNIGAKGIGEPPKIPTAPAIANAIYNAIGVRIKELPITPDKVLRILKI